MEPTQALAIINSLRFLANPTITEKTIIKTITAPGAQFVRIGTEGKLGVAYPFTFYSYQQSKTVVIWETHVLEGYTTSTEGSWSSKYDSETKATTHIRHPFLFEKKIVEHKGQVTVQPAGYQTHIKAIEQLVLEKGLLNLSCGCSTCSRHTLEGFGSDDVRGHQEKHLKQSALFAGVDLCSAVNAATGKIHLFVLAPATEGTFLVTSFSSKA